MDIRCEVTAEQSFRSRACMTTIGVLWGGG